MSHDAGYSLSFSPGLVDSRPLFCRVIDLRDATASIRIILLEVAAGGPLRFAAGQYVQVAFGDHRPRAFSLANRPDQPVLELHACSKYNLTDQSLYMEKIILYPPS